MERLPGKTYSSEDSLIEKYGLRKGAKVAFEKIAMHLPSGVKVGDIQDGTLAHDVRIGSNITFGDNSATTSVVTGIEEQRGQLFVHTTTSTYVLKAEHTAEGTDEFVWDDIEMVETGRGSTYRYLPDGTTQRFKKVEGQEYDPQAALVYVPDFGWIKQHASPEILKKVGEEDYIYLQRLLEYVLNPRRDGRKVYIVDERGKIIETNEEIKSAPGQIYLAFLKDGKTDFFIPVSHKPKLGFYTFDTRRYTDTETGEEMRERHLGNKVVRITLKKK